MKKKQYKQLFPVLANSVSTYLSNPAIMMPFVTIAFIQVLLIEVMYFAPRWPLVNFFGPLIRHKWGELYLHYPLSFVALPKMYQLAQVPIYLFISAFLVSVAISSINSINSGKSTTFGSEIKGTLPKYIHIFIAATVSFSIFYALIKGYGLIISRALKIVSTSGPYYMLKTAVLEGAPFVNLAIGVIVTSIFAFVLPLIIIENKKVFAAIILNFKNLWGSYVYIFLLVLIPTLFYVPMLLLRNNVPALADTYFPEIRVLVLIASILVMVIIDATVYTAITTYYLLKKEK